VRTSDLDLDAIQRRRAAARAFVLDDMRVRPTAEVRDFFDQDVPALLDALGRAFAVIRQNAITQANQERQLAETNRIVEAARAWRQDVDPRYGEASAEALCKAVDEMGDIAIQTAKADDEIRQLRAALTEVSQMTAPLSATHDFPSADDALQAVHTRSRRALGSAAAPRLSSEADRG
jgi:hypothetical protein